MTDRGLWIIGGAFLAGAGLIGLALVSGVLDADILTSPLGLAAAVPCVAAGGYIALRFPDVAVVALIVVDLAKLSEVTARFVGVGISLPILVVAAVSVAFAIGSGRLRPRWSTFYLWLLVLVTVNAASILVAGVGSAGYEALFEFAFDIGFLVVVLLWLTGRRSTTIALNTLILTMAALAGITVINEFVLGNSSDLFGLSNLHTTQVGGVTARHSGPEGDANFWARSLALVIPVALAAWATRKGTRTGYVMGAAAVTLGFGLYLTQSRGGLLAGAAGVVIWMVLSGRRYYRLLAFAPLVLVVVLALPGVGSRLTTLAEFDDSLSGGGDPSLQGRIGAQEAAVGMFNTEPILGVGYGQFGEVVSETHRDLGIQAEALDSHNLYLEILAETGVIGLLAWILLLGFVLVEGTRVVLLSRRRRSDEGHEARVTASGITAGLLAWMAASVFLHAASLRVLFLGMAIVIGMSTSVDEPEFVEELEDGEPLIPGFARLRGWIPAAVGLSVFLAVAAIGLAARPEVPQDSVVERSILITTGENATLAYEPYNQDLIARGLVGASYAEILENGTTARAAGQSLGWVEARVYDFAVDAFYVPSEQIVTLSVVGPDQEAASRLAQQIVSTGTEMIDELEQPFIIEDVEQSAVWVQGTGWYQDWRSGVVLVVALVTAGFAGVVTSKLGTSRRRGQQ